VYIAAKSKPTMKTQLNWALLAIPTLFLGACGSGESADADLDMDSVKAEIQALEDAYAAASNAKDVDGVVAYYANDAQSLADKEPTRVGMDEIKAGIARDMADDTSGYTVSFTVTGVWAAGNYATETGTVAVKDAAGTVVETGKYMTLFEKRDGKYVAIRDIWNDDTEGDDAEDSDADEGDEDDD
jgi:ketosteroid isomerase-like protein